MNTLFSPFDELTNGDRIIVIRNDGEDAEGFFSGFWCDDARDNGWTLELKPLDSHTPVAIRTGLISAVMKVEK